MSYPMDGRLPHRHDLMSEIIMLAGTVQTLAYVFG
jgi:hypothetical protein